ncbi:MAG: protein kinase, partial [Verrucomicrobiota bacterium]
MAGDNAALPSTTPPTGRAYEVLTPGEKFGEYQVLKCQSYDLLGSLYLARKTRMKEVSSLFVLPPLVKNESPFRDRFFQSTTKLCRLEHPNILKLQDADILKNRFTLFHEAFEGQNLADYLEAYALEKTSKAEEQSTEDLLADVSVGLPQEDVEEILRQVLGALHYAHSQRVMHLNLNPPNILRSEDGTIKVVEFGLMTMAGKPLFESLVSAGIPPISLGPRRIRINTVDILSPEVRLGTEGNER